jgi:hypothetical protein
MYVFWKLPVILRPLIEVKQQCISDQLQDRLGRSQSIHTGPVQRISL